MVLYAVLNNLVPIICSVSTAAHAQVNRPAREKLACQNLAINPIPTTNRPQCILTRIFLWVKRIDR
jgi:hypothetical protein